MLGSLLSVDDQIEKSFFIRKLNQIIGANPFSSSVALQRSANQPMHGLLQQPNDNLGQSSEQAQRQQASQFRMAASLYPVQGAAVSKGAGKQVPSELLIPIFNKLREQNKPIYQFLETLLSHVNLSRQSLKMPDIAKQLDVSYPNLLNKREKGILLGAIDANQDGSVDLNEITMFFRKHGQEKQISLRLVILLLAKRLELEELSTADYFK